MKSSILWTFLSYCFSVDCSAQNFKTHVLVSILRVMVLSYKKEISLTLPEIHPWWQNCVFPSWHVNSSEGKMKPKSNNATFLTWQYLLFITAICCCIYVLHIYI